MRFPKSARLLAASEFQRVFQQASTKVSHRHLLMLAIESQCLYPRLGLVIAKKNVRLAVQRNRVKRLIRETFRQQQAKLPPIDVIVLARRGMDTLSNPQLQQLLDQQWHKLKQKVETA